MITDLIAVANISDYILSNSLVAMAISMVAEQRETNTILAELFSARGNEIYLRDSREYIPVNSVASFYTMMKLARMRGHIVLGYKLPTRSRRTSSILEPINIEKSPKVPKNKDSSEADRYDNEDDDDDKLCFALNFDPSSTVLNPPNKDRLITWEAGCLVVIMALD